MAVVLRLGQAMSTSLELARSLSSLEMRCLLLRLIHHRVKRRLLRAREMRGVLSLRLSMYA